jgi:molecular chaperone DnaK (HSP70)
VDEVLLIGGTTLIPAVQRGFSRFFGKPVQTSPRADIAVAVGATLQTGAHSQVATQVPTLATQLVNANSR